MTLTKELSEANEKRRQWAESDAERDAAIPMPMNITQIVDIIYAESETEDEKQWHLADIYYPKKNLMTHILSLSIYMAEDGFMVIRSYTADIPNILLSKDLR
ncbi:MAG: hypothetical protein IJN43_10395 [Ruminococcus sp.]|nr:hypothetical protein [Ruminococcus sp.]